MDPLLAIHGYLSAFRWRKALVHLVRDTGLFLAAGAMVLLLTLALASLSRATNEIRMLLLSALLLALLGFGLHLVRAMRRLTKVHHLARLIDSMCPELQGDLLSSVELSQDQSGAAARYSPPMMLALAGHTWQRLQARPVSALVPPSLLLPAAMLLAVTTLGWATAATLTPELLLQGGARLFSTAAVVPTEAASEPLVGDLSLRYRYPAHMGRQDKLVESSTGHVTAPKGTMVTLSTTPLVPSRRVTLVLAHDSNPPRRIQLKPRKASAAMHGTFEVTGPGTYQVELETLAGRGVRDPVQRRVLIEPDAFPRVTLYGPRTGLEVTPRHRVEVGYVAEDDHGLSGIWLVHQLGQEPPRRKRLWAPGGKRRLRNAVGKWEWDLARLTLPPGARISYWVEAEDNDRVSGPKKGRSATLLLKVYSPEEKHAESLKLQQQAMEQALRLLAARLLLFEKEPVLSPALRLEKNRTIHQAGARLVDALAELRAKMRKDPLGPAATRRTISQIHQRLARLLRTEQGLLRAVEPPRQRSQVRATHLVPLEEHNRKLVTQLEHDVLLLADLLDEQHVSGMADLVQRIKAARKALAAALKRYRKTPTEALRREVMRRIREIERLLAKLRARAARLQSRLPDEYLNAEALGGVDLEARVRQIKELVRKGDLGQVDRAIAALDKALARMEQLVQGNLRSYRKGRMPRREQRFAKLRDRLRGLEQEQREIAGRTKRIISSYRRRAAELMKKTIHPFIRRQLVKLNELRRKLGEVDARVLSPYDQEQLQRARQRTGNLKALLEQGDLDEALQMARRARNIIQVLEDDLSEEVVGQYAWRRKRLRKSHKRSRAARKLADDLVNDLAAIFPSPRSLLDPAERKRLRGLQRRQQGLRRQVQQTLGKLGKEQGKGSFLGPQGVQNMRDSSELMGKAHGKLRGLQVQESHGFQEAAADKLAQCRKRMASSRRSARNGGGRQVRSERVKIPGADSFRPPKEFRQDIMEAMKERAPEAFQRQVKRYYEELVR